MPNSSTPSSPKTKPAPKRPRTQQIRGQNTIMARRLKKPYRNILKTAAVIALIVILKWLWVTISTMGHGTFEGEKTEILRRRNYLTNQLLVALKRATAISFLLVLFLASERRLKYRFTNSVMA